MDGDRSRLDWSVDLRYSRQVHEVTTPVRGATPLDEARSRRLVDDFEALYERKYGKGSAYREAGMEMTMFRLTARGLMDRAQAGADWRFPSRIRRRRAIGRRPIFVEAKNGMADADIYDFQTTRARQCACRARR